MGAPCAHYITEFILPGSIGQNELWYPKGTRTYTLYNYAFGQNHGRMESQFPIGKLLALWILLKYRRDTIIYGGGVHKWKKGRGWLKKCSDQKVSHFVGTQTWLKEDDCGIFFSFGEGRLRRLLILIIFTKIIGVLLISIISTRIIRRLLEYYWYQ